MATPDKKHRNIVVLVDSRKRDLPVAALLAHHLEEFGIQCHLEPLEAYRAVLATYRPDMIVFNHLTASHLAEYSRRLAKMGVLTSVLSNEGINYDPDDLKFMSGKHHTDAHIDWFYCWNIPHRNSLNELGFGKHTRIEVIGVPRFDYYFEPWSRTFQSPRKQERDRPRILICTNFQLAKFWELPPEHGDKFFAAWKDRIPIYKNYWQAIEDHFNARKIMFGHLNALAAEERYELIIRPHPREDTELYKGWREGLSSDLQRNVIIDNDSNISAAIMDCDLEISCETCTTAIESWIVGKPTIELVFFKNPMFFHPEHAAASTQCEKIEQLPDMIDQLLNYGESEEIFKAQEKHLKKWCDTPKGDSCLRLASLIAKAVRNLPEPDWTQLEFTDHRRATKLKFLRQLGVAYHFDPFMPLKSAINPDRYAIKRQAYEKSITPEDVTRAQRLLANSLADPEGRK